MVAVAQSYRGFLTFPGASVLWLEPAIGHSARWTSWRAAAAGGTEAAEDAEGPSPQRGMMLAAASPHCASPQDLGFPQALLQERSSCLLLPPTSGNHE